MSWVADDGSTQATTLVHNEYLQTLAELGAPGMVLVLTSMVFVAAALLPALRRPVATLVLAGAIPGLVLAVASSGDFLWHVAVVPVLAAVLAGTAIGATETPDGRPPALTSTRSLPTTHSRPGPRG